MNSRKRTRTLRKPRQVQLTLDDDLRLARTPRTKKRPTPKTKRSVLNTGATPSEVITLDDSLVANQILNDVDSKVGTFMKSGNFISSDEEEVEIIKTKTNKKLSPTMLFISDDSDDEDKNMRHVQTSNVDISKPGTSSGTVSDSPVKNKVIELDDDIMEFVDSVLDNKADNTQNALKDIKSLEDYRKETEEMLKNASTLLNEIKTGGKSEPEPKLQQTEDAESPTKATVVQCPICLESLATRPASVTVCGHMFCKNCIAEVVKTLKKCPTCRKPINSKKIHPIYF